MFGRKRHTYALQPVRDVEPRKAGRPSFLEDPQTQQLLLEVVAKGLPYVMCADLIGCDRVTFMRWLDRIEDGDFDCTFRNQFKAAQAVGVLERLEHIGKGKTGWQGPAWINERRFPEHFKDQGKAPKSQTIVQTTGTVEVKNVDDVSQLSDEELAEQIARLEAERRKGNA